MVDPKIIQEDETAVKELEKKIDPLFNQAEEAKKVNDLNKYNNLMAQIKPLQQELEDKRKVAFQHAAGR